MNSPVSYIHGQRLVHTWRRTRPLSYGRRKPFQLGASRIALLRSFPSSSKQAFSTHQQPNSALQSEKAGCVLDTGHDGRTSADKSQQEPPPPRAIGLKKHAPRTGASGDQSQDHQTAWLKSSHSIPTPDGQQAQPIRWVAGSETWWPGKDEEIKQARVRRIAKQKKHQAAIVRLRQQLRQASPSLVLAKALEDVGLNSCLPYDSQGKLDLSYGDSWHPSSIRNHPASMFSEQTSLQSILADCIRTTRSAEPNRAAWRSEIHREYLEKRHFDFENVASWADVVTSKSSDEAATRLLSLSRSSSDPERAEVNKAPVFLVMFLLRRKDLTPTAFKLLLLHSLEFVSNTRHPDFSTKEAEDNVAMLPTCAVSGAAPSGNYPDLDWSTISVLLIRLLRMARKHWPESISRLVEVFTGHHEFKPDEKQDPRRIKRLTFMYNRLLQLLSIPTQRDPFQNIGIIQKAQLSVLHRMTEFQPALPVNREGYHAMVGTQLKYSKTQRERDWAHLQSKAWPPWKEDKHGLDADKGIEYGMSRATQTLARAVEAGYPPEIWEKTAGILAGWDTDRSPTVQVRTHISSHINGRKASAGVERKDGSNSASQAGNERTHIWAARIEATRTLDEAWACFLSYKHERKQWSHTVCYTMFRKIVHARLFGTETPFPNPKTMYNFSRPRLTPGDSWHIWQVSENPRERPYLPEPPPNEHDFMNDILRHNVILRGHFLAFALLHAENLGVGFQYLHVSNLTSPVKSFLMGNRKKLPEKDALPPRVLASFVQLLCRFNKPSDADKEKLIETPNYRPDALIDASESLANNVFDLLVNSNTKYAPAWVGLFQAIVRRAEERTGAESRSLSGSDQDEDWKAVMNILAEMHNRGINTDFGHFTGVCHCFAKAVKGPDRPISDVKRSLVYVNQLKTIFLCIAGGSSITYRDIENSSYSSPVSLFPTAGGIGQDYSRLEKFHGMADSLPRLINIPRPAHLHAFIRALGKAGDFGGIVDLLRWMVQYAPELQAKIKGHRNAQPQLRHTLVAARVILERWMPDDGPRPLHQLAESGRNWKAGNAVKDAKELLVEQARCIFASQEDWMGLWPNDKECDTYCFNDVGPRRDERR